MKRAAMVALIMMAGFLVLLGNPLVPAQAAQTTTTASAVTTTLSAVNTAASAVTATAINTSFSGLTYAKAVEAALTSSSDLKTKQLNLDKADSQYDDTYATFYSMSFSDVVTQDSAYTEKKWAEMQIAIEKEAIAIQVENQMNSINQLKNQIDLAKLQQSVQNTDLAIALDKQNAGLIGEYDLNTIKNQKKETDKNLELKQLALENAYLSFMKLTGLTRAQVLDPENRIIYTPVQDTADAFVARQLGENPHIWYYEKLLSGAKLGLTLYEANTGSSYTVKSDDASQASNNLLQLKQNLTNSLKSKYNDAMTLEKNYELGQLTIEKTAQDLESAQVRYAAGLCTETDVLNAKLAYVQAEDSQETIILQHIQDVNYLNKPYTNPDYL